MPGGPLAPAAAGYDRRVHLHLLDGTYELFRNYYGAPKRAGPDGMEVGAVQGLVAGTLSLLQEGGVTHLGAAFDTVIRSFRNDLFPGYKTEAGVPADLLAQFPIAEEGLEALGVVVWRMTTYEADDALATAAARFAPQVEQVVLMSPDKDLAQCVEGRRVVCYDRRKGAFFDEARGLGEVRRGPGVDPRLPGPGGRQRRRPARGARLGGQDHGGDPGRVPPPRGHPPGGAAVEARGAGAGAPGGGAARQPRRGPGLPVPGHPAARRAAGARAWPTWSGAGCPGSGSCEFCERWGFGGLPRPAEALAGVRGTNRRGEFSRPFDRRPLGWEVHLRFTLGAGWSHAGRIVSLPLVGRPVPNPLGLLLPSSRRRRTAPPPGCTTRRPR